MISHSFNNANVILCIILYKCINNMNSNILLTVHHTFFCIFHRLNHLILPITYDVGTRTVSILQIMKLRHRG